MNIAVVTLIPAMLDALRAGGVTARAEERGLFAVTAFNPRDFTDDRHRTVDDRPYGGGPGMVLMFEPMFRAIEAARASLGGSARTVLLSPQGARLDQAAVRRLAGEEALVLLCGRYEGVDERLVEAAVDEEVSLGDFVLSGGEPAVLALIDAMARLLPGALGHRDSAAEDSFTDGLLDWPHYTRPERLGPEHGGRAVPPVLLGGDHGAVRRWREKEALGRTWLRRPDLLHGLDPAARRSSRNSSPSIARTGSAGAQLTAKSAPSRAPPRRANDERREGITRQHGPRTMPNIIEEIEREQMVADLPDFAPGDTVVVRVRVREGSRERVQAFEGVVIAIRNRGLNSAFTVRKVSHGEGVERVFQTHSPALAGIEVKRRGAVRRAKLYYLRERSGQSARIKEKLKRK